MLLLQYDACPSVINGSAQIPKDITHDEEIRSMLEGLPIHIIHHVTLNWGLMQSVCGESLCISLVVFVR